MERQKKNPWPLEGSFEYLNEFTCCKTIEYYSFRLPSKYSGRSLIVMGLISPKIRNPDVLSIIKKRIDSISQSISLHQYLKIYISTRTTQLDHRNIPIVLNCHRQQLYGRILTWLRCSDLKATKSFLIAFRFITDISKSRLHKYYTYGLLEVVYVSQSCKFFFYTSGRRKHLKFCGAIFMYCRLPFRLRALYTISLSKKCYRLEEVSSATCYLYSLQSWHSRGIVI